ncbi:17819_t:CDS:2, partial [Cetraspora pellucida]
MKSSPTKVGFSQEFSCGRGKEEVRKVGGRIGPTNFTNAEAIKNNFLAHTRGSHNLLEDCQILADFANSIANINNDIQEMTLAVNEQEFNNRKQQSISKLQG